MLSASCQRAEDPYMTLATNTLNVEPEGGVFTVDLSANVYYRVNNDCQTDGGENYWAVIDSYETQGDVTRFTIKVSENTTTAARVGSVRFIEDGDPERHQSHYRIRYRRYNGSDVQGLWR